MSQGRLCRRLQWAGALALACAAAFGASPAGAVEVTQAPADVRQYWTEERMENAIPGSELLEDVELPLVGSAAGLVGGAEEPRLRAAAQRVSDPDRAPVRTHGKVFFTLAGVQYVCSATVIRAENRRLALTAGHCVYGFGMYASNWMFVPAKDGSSEPYGRWAATELKATSQWEASEDIRYDVGMAKLERRNKRPIQKVVGARRVVFNQGRDLIFKAFGYPAESPFNGQELYRCKSPAQGTDSGPPPQPTRIDCNMTGGSSGGGWVVPRKGVNSVVSYGYECLPILIIIPCDNPEEGKLFGPYFGDVIKQLYRSMQRR